MPIKKKLSNDSKKSSKPDSKKLSKTQIIRDKRNKLRQLNPSYNQRNNIRFEMVGIKLASPEKIKEWSQRRLPNGEIVGEVRKPETMNYRTGKAEFDGLLCEKIFGPIKSWECSCGQHKIFKPAKRPFYCSKCWVEVTESHVRRHRMGHVVLNYPVTHPWYLKGSPSYLSIILDSPVKELEKIIYLENEKKSLEELENDAKEEKKRILGLEKDISPKKLKSLSISQGNINDWLVEWKKNTSDLKLEWLKNEDNINFNSLKPKIKRFKKRTDQELFEIEFNKLLLANYGSRRILNLLQSLKIEDQIKVIKNELSITSKSKREKLLKRLRLFESFKSTKNDPSWMIISILPILPPSLRPVIELGNGTYTSSEFNDHYRRVILRNNRLMTLCRELVPDFIVIEEKCLIQEAVSQLIDNTIRLSKDSSPSRDRPLRCLNDLIAGKEGRFRQNLLGKRVDYSGRSVIVVGPNLMLDQCAIPYEMALKLFSPYLVYKIHEIIPKAKGLDTTELISALQRNYPIVWVLLNLILSNSLVMLNRAPTLHRLGIQAFRPLLSTGKAIQLHPLVCPGFNADFDGDQMGVHLPLTRKTQLEAYRMLSSNNLLSPANGRPILTPGQDIVLGWYYLTTRTLPNLKGSNLYFTTFSEISDALEHSKINIHSTIWIKYSGKVIGIKANQTKLKREEMLKDGSSIEIYEDIQLKKDRNNKIIFGYIKTTPGRVLINELIAAAIFAKPL
uniref:DNA-directed RNA polymerase subunit n=1 Tax=Pseudellipsoidion edaphicum TaxID=1431838 RepID=A0A3R5QP23_9STRA|nr:RNA polymerase b'-subunit [Pseudellipsoidion edaphicum]QAA12014.1 RNA polymerase b'-subunit [Pseudellipsoidion edaphicum]